MSIILLPNILYVNVNGSIFREATNPFSFLPPLLQVNSREQISSLWGNFYTTKSWPIFRKLSPLGKCTGNHELFPFVNMAEKHNAFFLVLFHDPQKG